MAKQEANQLVNESGQKPKIWSPDGESISDESDHDTKNAISY